MNLIRLPSYSLLIPPYLHNSRLPISYHGSFFIVRFRFVSVVELLQLLIGSQQLSMLGLQEFGSNWYSCFRNMHHSRKHHGAVFYANRLFLVFMFADLPTTSASRLCFSQPFGRTSVAQLETPLPLSPSNGVPSVTCRSCPNHIRLCASCRGRLSFQISRQ